MSFRTLIGILTTCLFPSLLIAGDISGVYLETRTCQVYTGPCFANGEVGLAGKSAVMAWGIEQGKHQGVDVSGLNVLVALNAADTLDFQGVAGAKDLKTVIIVDAAASEQQRSALVDFAKVHAGRAGQFVVRIDAQPIKMSLDTTELQGSLQAGKTVKLTTRKARPGDCICGNESAYYPPLAKVKNFAAGVAIESEFKGRGLGTRWSFPNSRSAYMATFVY